MAAYLNIPVVEVAKALLSRYAGGGYDWKPGDPGNGHGVLEDVVHRGVTILRRGKGTYCCGFTFEVWWRALELVKATVPLPVLELRELQRDWFNARTTRTGPHALARYGLGEIVRPEDATPGDFAQLWRQGGGGHSVVVLERHEDGRLTYLSTQPSTNGIGKRTERDFAELYVCRAVVPGAAP